MLLTFALVVIGWIIFRAENISQAWDYLSRMCSMVQSTVPLIIRKKTFLFIAIMLFVEWVNREKAHGLQFNYCGILKHRFIRWVFYALMILFIKMLSGAQSDFIYFQF
jgi:hypothetical protein